MDTRFRLELVTLNEIHFYGCHLQWDSLQLGVINIIANIAPTGTERPMETLTHEVGH